MIKNTRRSKYRIFNCEVCGRTFRASRQHVRTCSPACRKKLSRAGQNRKPKSVPHVTLQQLELLLREHGAN